MKLFPTTFWVAAVISLSMPPAMRAAVDTVTSTADSGPGSLRDTIATANSGDTIIFSQSLAGQTIYLTSGELLVTNSITIDASALAGGIIIDAGQNSRVLEIGSTNVTLDSITVTNGNAGPGGDGGGIECISVSGTLALNNCIVSGNSALNGGGIENEAAASAFYQCTFSGNSAGNFGGGIATGSGILSATNCSFFGNSASEGGALLCPAGGTLDNCVLSTNCAANGAGIFVNNGPLALNYCILNWNDATNGAGGGVVNGNILTANGCVFFNNTATNGGAIVNAFEAMLNNCTVDGNSVTNGNGGGIFNYETLAVNDCTLNGNNVVNGNGGAIYNDIDGVSAIVLTNTTVDGNSASGYGGGIANGGILTANNCSIYDNAATNGGAIFNAVSMTLNNCTLSANFAAQAFPFGLGNGGGIYAGSAYAIYGEYATNFLVNCTVYGNYANGGYGGGIYNDSSSTLALTNTIVSGNSASADVDIYGVYSGVANFIGGNPQLAGTGNYGGPILTRPPEFGSPVIDAGTDWVTNFLATDQRGYPRLAGAHVDIGAVEAQTAPANDSPVLRNEAYVNSGSNLSDSFRFTFTNAVFADFTVLATTNLALPLAQWTVVGNATRNVLPNGYGYIEPAAGIIIGTTNYTSGVPPQQFYRVVSP